MSLAWGTVAVLATVIGLLLVAKGTGWPSALLFVLAAVATAKAFLAWADADRDK